MTMSQCRQQNSSTNFHIKPGDDEVSVMSTPSCCRASTTREVGLRFITGIAESNFRYTQGPHTLAASAGSADETLFYSGATGQRLKASTSKFE